MLNPNSFKSFDDFQKARLRDGLRRGWTPRAVNVSISRKTSEFGKKIVNKILGGGDR